MKQTVVNFRDVFAGGFFPGEFHGHAVDAVVLEQFRFFEKREGFTDAFGQDAVRIFGEFYAVRAIPILRDVGDGVVEAAGDADDGTVP